MPLLEPPGVDPELPGDDSVHEFLFAHFERKDRHVLSLRCRRVPRPVEGQRRLPHLRPGGDDREGAWLQSGQQLIEVAKSSSDAAENCLVFGSVERSESFIALRPIVRDMLGKRLRSAPAGDRDEKLFHPLARLGGLDIRAIAWSEMTVRPYARTRALTVEVDPNFRTTGAGFLSGFPGSQSLAGVDGPRGAIT